MPTISSLSNQSPIELIAGPSGGSQEIPQEQLARQGLDDKGIAAWIKSERDRLSHERTTKRDIWDACWALYRGEEDFSDKEEWQSQITLPKSWNSVKNATNAMMRLLQTNEHPWQIDAINPDDAVTVQRADQVGDLLKLFLLNSDFLRAFQEGLESSFIMGMGVWKGWWGLEERQRLRSAIAQDPETGRQARQVMMDLIEEGKLFWKAVDPYNFFWLPGSRFNKWVGTFEDIEISEWELKDLANKGLLDTKAVARVKGGTTSGALDLNQKAQRLRFAEQPTPRGGGGQRKTGVVKLTDYYGPLLDKEGNVVERHAHVIIGNDSEVLLRQRNIMWQPRPPYVAFSPLLLPFRTEGVGLIEMTKQVDKALNQLTNMSMDKTLYTLLPTFEAVMDAYENPEDIETGLVPGKVLRRDRTHIGMPGLTPIKTDDINNGTTVLMGILDRAHQEGSLISEIQQGIPRFRGVQTLGEIELKDAQQQGFLSALAKDVDEFAIKPIVELSMDLMLQFLDTSADPRVGSVLGIGAEVVRGMNQSELLDLITGDYIVKVSGVTDQIQKVEQLQSLVQFMNIVGQNDQWMNNVDQGQLLYRVIEALRGSIRDIDNIILTPEAAEARRHALAQSELTPELIRLMPQIIQLGAQLQRDGQLDETARAMQPQVQQTLEQQQAAAQQQAERQQLLQELEFQALVAELQRRIAGVPVQGDRGGSR